MKKQQNNFQLPLLVALGIFLLISVGVAMNTAGNIADLEATAREALRPAKLELVTLLAGDCAACDAQAQTLLDQIKANANITAETTLSVDEGKLATYAEQYGIERLPAIIITGEVEKATFAGMEERGDARVFEATAVPYVTIAGETRGLVTATILSDEACDQCADPSTILGGLVQAGMTINDASVVASDSVAGKQLISEYALTKAPSIVLSGDIDAYPEIAAALPTIGRSVGDAFVIEQGLVPYVQLDTKTVKGLVDITYLDDSSCEECYDVQTHKQILAQANVKIGEEKTLDINDIAGKALIAKYDIAQAPIILLSSNANLYPTLVKAWQQVGTQEADGTLVFRKAEVMGTYKDLESGEVVTQ